MKSVDLFKEETAKKHYTADYETSELVFRRGFPFRLMIVLSRPLKSTEKFELELRMGNNN